MDSEPLRNELLTSQWYGISPGNISYTGGNVGIGTNNPVYKFNVDGGAIGVTGTNNYLYYAVTNSTSSGAYMMFDAQTAGGSGRKYQIGSTGSGNNPGTGCFELYDATGNATRLVVNASGNVGIGTNNPVYTLDVNGTGRFAAGTLTVPTILATTTVGINTTVSPGTTPLQVFWNSSKNTTGWALAVGDTTGYNNGNSSPVLLSVLYNAVATGQGVVQQFGKGGANSLFTSYQYNSGGTDKIGWTWFGVAPYTQLCMLATGNVGIGSSSPTEKLDVAGNTTVSGVMKNPGRPMSMVGKNNGDVSAAGFVTFNSVLYNIGSMYNSTNGRWTASVAGYYQFTFCGISRFGSNNPNMRWYKNNADFGWGTTHCNFTNVTAPYHMQQSCSVIIFLAVNDYIQFYVLSDGFYGGSTLHNTACCIFLG